MSSKGFTLVEIMVVTLIIALLTAIAIPNLLRSKMIANDAATRSNLKGLSTACETFASINSGNYPTEITSLTGPVPPYLGQDYCGASISGFSFTCTFSPAGYTFAAVPLAIGSSGSTTFTISTGGVLTP